MFDNFIKAVLLWYGFFVMFVRNQFLTHMAKQQGVNNKKLADLTPDNINANKGTEYGRHLLEKSFRELGAGRSLLLDKNGRIIAGNKSAEMAGEIGLDDVIIVPTDGTKLVAVQRTDIDLDSEMGRKLAIADNATSKANLEWDADAVQQIAEGWGIVPEDWGVRVSFGEENDYEGEYKGMPEYESEDKLGVKQIVVHFATMEDYHDFANILGQKLTDKTKAIWHPVQARESQIDHIYSAE